MTDLPDWYHEPGADGDAPAPATEAAAAACAAHSTTTVTPPAVLREIEAARANALTRARARLSMMFDSPSSLAEIETRRAELVRQSVAAAAAVSAGLHAHHNSALKAAAHVDVFEDGLAGVREAAGSTASAAAECRGSIGAHPTVRAAQWARRNLAATLSQLEEYHRVPSVCRSMLEDLQASPLSLKRAYVEAVKLEIWRDTLVKAVARAARRTRAARATRKGPRQRRRSSLDAGALNKVVGVMGEHFDSVRTLMDAVTARVLGNIRGCVELAVSEPATLVMTCEVVEMNEACVAEHKAAAMRWARGRAEKVSGGSEGAALLCALRFAVCLAEIAVAAEPHRAGPRPPLRRCAPCC